MTELPPEIAEARSLLHQVLPAPFSKARVYERVLNQRMHYRHTRTRATMLVFCIVASSSAMAFGYHWVTSQPAAAPPLTAETRPSPMSAPVPRKHQSDRPAPHENAGAIGNTEVPSVAGSGEPASETRNLVAPGASQADARPAGTARATDARARQAGSSPLGSPEATPLQSSSPRESELARQVRDYHQAVAPMRVDPRLALERLQSFRRKWQQSSIVEEVDLREIEALLLLGRRVEAVRAARRFVQRYPSSARASEMQRIADERPPGTARFD